MEQLFILIDGDLGWDNIVLIVEKEDLIHEYLQKRNYTLKQIEYRDIGSYAIVSNRLTTKILENGDYV